MADSADERRHKRFHVTGSFAKVECKSFEVEDASARVRGEGLIPAIVGYPDRRYELLNISKGGLSFESNDVFKRGQRVWVELHMPGLDGPLELRGVVRWRRGVMGSEVFKVGVQFSPFGERRGLNTMAALEKLRDLESKSTARHSAESAN